MRSSTRFDERYAGVQRFTARHDAAGEPRSSRGSRFAAMWSLTLVSPKIFQSVGITLPSMMACGGSRHSCHALMRTIVNPSAENEPAWRAM